MHADPENSKGGGKILRASVQAVENHYRGNVSIPLFPAVHVVDFSDDYNPYNHHEYPAEYDSENHHRSISPWFIIAFLRMLYIPILARPLGVTSVSGLNWLSLPFISGAVPCDISRII